MYKYHTAQICLNGHAITGDISDGTDEKFCSKCGASTIAECPHCKIPIRGSWIIEGMASFPFTKSPAFCKECGEPYPWTELAKESIRATIEEESEFDSEQKEALVEIIPDIMVETPKTQLGITRIKKSLLVAGKFTAEAIRQFIIDFGCEVAIKKLGL